MSDDDFYLLVPEDEWVEERLSNRTPYDPDEVIPATYPAAPAPPEGFPWWWEGAWTALGLALWTAFCVWQGFPAEVGGFGAAMLIWLRRRARRR